MFFSIPIPLPFLVTHKPHTFSTFCADWNPSPEFPAFVFLQATVVETLEANLHDAQRNLVKVNRSLADERAAVRTLKATLEEKQQVEELILGGNK